DCASARRLDAEPDEPGRRLRPRPAWRHTKLAPDRARVLVRRSVADRARPRRAAVLGGERREAAASALIGIASASARLELAVRPSGARGSQCLADLSPDSEEPKRVTRATCAR